jgi:hypothetical protein
MRRTVVMHVPVHREPILPEQLHAIHPDVVGLGFGITAIIGVDCVDPRERDESTTILRVPL